MIATSLDKIMKYETIKKLLSAYLELDQNPAYPSVSLTETLVRVEDLSSTRG